MPEPLPPQSSHELVRGFSQRSIDQYDLITPAPAGPIILKAHKIEGENFFSSSGSVRDSLRRNFPTFKDVFRRGFVGSLTTVIGEKSQVTGMELLRVYEDVVESDVAKLSKQIRVGMFMPDAYGRFFDYFDVPVDPGIVQGLLGSNPPLAEAYLQRTLRWVSGT